MSFPWMIYFFFRLALCMRENWDLALVCTVAAGLNFYQTRAKPYWHIYQVTALRASFARKRGAVSDYFNDSSSDSVSLCL